MPRKFLNKLLPDRQKLRRRLGDKWYVRPFRELLHDPALWHIGRRNSCGALALGLFICCLPIPGHMALAVLGAFYWRLNLPLAVLATWVNNPLTLGPIYFGGYELGAVLLHIKPLPFPAHLSLNWLLAEFSRIWAPLWLGCVIVGILLSLIGYVALRIVWQISIRRRWRRRQQARARKHAAAPHRQ